MLRASILFSILSLAVLVVVSLAIFTGIRSGELNGQVFSNASSKFVDFLKAVSQAPAPVPVDSQITSSASSEIKININQTGSQSKEQPTNSLPKTPPPPPQQCYRYTVTHLDGSTSNRCYSRSDYNLLVDLGYKLSSAKTFFEFHQDSAARYQDEYNRTGSSIYLDAKASSEASAKREQEKIGQITLQMQQIEQRGY